MNIIKSFILERMELKKRISDTRRMTSKELVEKILRENAVNTTSISEKNAKLILVDMDFEEVEKDIFGTKNLDCVEFDNGHPSVVSTGYPFMDKITTLTEKRLGMRGIHAMK